MNIFFVRHGQTQMNLENRSYDNLGADEIYHITEKGLVQADLTGKYLKQFGPFDAIYSSPRHRCLETLKKIIEHIDFPEDVYFATDELLYEGVSGILNGLTNAETAEILKKYDDIQALKLKISNELNPFTKIKLRHEYDNLYAKHIGTTPQDECVKNYAQFLEKIKKTKYKNILVVCHGGTIWTTTYHVTNISQYNFDVMICPPQFLSDKKMYEKGNCMIMALQYRQEDDKYELVISPNTLHLEELSKDL